MSEWTESIKISGGYLPMTDVTLQSKLEEVWRVVFQRNGHPYQNLWKDFGCQPYVGRKELTVPSEFRANTEYLVETTVSCGPMSLFIRQSVSMNGRQVAQLNTYIMFAGETSNTPKKLRELFS